MYSMGYDLWSHHVRALKRLVTGHTLVFEIGRGGSIEWTAFQEFLARSGPAVGFAWVSWRDEKSRILVAALPESDYDLDLMFEDVDDLSHGQLQSKKTRDRFTATQMDDCEGIELGSDGDEDPPPARKKKKPIKRSGRHAAEVDDEDD